MNDKSNQTLTGKNVILATGARARNLPGLEADGKLVWTYKEAMVPPEFPKSLLVIGSGAIGIEFASFYRTMGAEVTVCEVVDRILPVEDEEVSAFAKRRFEKQGMKILHRRDRVEPEEGRQQRHGDHHAGRQDAGDHRRSRDLGRSASSATSRTSASKAPR
jgi:pyruvate/2-oxoglutarate dehydrogenase complex dihydrolipoamide dehydrogenase (E3) component